MTSDTMDGMRMHEPYEEPEQITPEELEDFEQWERELEPVPA